MKSNQNGFAPIVIASVAIAVLVIGGAGVWYYSKINEHKPAPASSQPAVHPSTQIHQTQQIDRQTGQIPLESPTTTQAQQNTPVAKGQETQTMTGISPTSSIDISGWQDYKDRKNCVYQIKYPGSYTMLGPQVDNGKYTVSFVAPFSLCQGVDARCDFNITCAASKTFLDGSATLDDYIKKKTAEGEISEKFQPQKTNVGSYDGLEVEGITVKDVSPKTFKEVYLQEGNYIFQFDSQEKENSEGIKTFDQVLSTFKVATGGVNCGNGDCECDSGETVENCPDDCIAADHNPPQTKVTFLAPDDSKAYTEYMLAPLNAEKQGPKTWSYIKKTVCVPYTTDIIKASAQAAVGESIASKIIYFKIENGTAYILLEMDVDGWAGVSFTIATTHPIIEQTLLQFPQIKKVVFDHAPDYQACSKDSDCSYYVCGGCVNSGSGGFISDCQGLESANYACSCKSGVCTRNPICGDVICEDGENAANCPQDCNK